MLEPKSYEVIFKYYLPDNNEDLLLHVNARNMWNLIYGLDQICRRVIKHEDNPETTRLELAEQLRDFIHSNIDLDMVS